MSSITSSEDDYVKVAKSVRVWLFIGVVLVFFQVVIGGITRLTDSGLSITDWEIIQGVLPPTNQEQWLEAFNKYKIAAKKQFETLHAGMSLSEFKFIYFWEYFHRLWARMMGLVFALPFFYFLVKKMMPRWLIRRLVVVIGLAAFAAAFGWIMVSSGLNDDTRTWVSAYKLVGHLSIATVLFGYLFWTWLLSDQPIVLDTHFNSLYRSAFLIAMVIAVQIVFGGLMAGMRAGLIHPHFPYFIEGHRFYHALFSANESSATDILINYEPSLKIKAWIQLFHRAIAFLLVILISQFFFKAIRLKISPRLKFGVYLLITMLIIQFLLGVLTIINSIGRIPIGYGSLHQSFALILFASILFVNYQLLSRPN